MRAFPRGRRGWLRAALVTTAPLAMLLGLAMFTTRMPGRSHQGPLPPLDRETTLLRERLRSHVEVLAGRIGERNLWRPEALAEAARYVEDAFRSSGHEVHSQAFTVEGRAVRNLEVRLPGAARPDEVVVVGAHYDSVLGSPGADDNATGVAALLEIARAGGGRRPSRTLHLVAFVNEEPPFFLGEDMGSLRYARRLREEGRDVVAMLSLETIGYYSDRLGSQHYPFPFRLFYPDRGDFLGVVGNTASRALVRRTVASLRRHATLPAEGLAAPGWITGVGWSDHWSFWQHGYPAAMVTDTALFRYPHYHAPTDLPPEVDYDRHARAVAGLIAVVGDLCEADPP
ncbi:MAG TPA: M28 family peptidase [Vicinamibacteria bacterium]|nr:M28 family peptidase [Vicinamibacteria bacterium]